MKSIFQARKAAKAVEELLAPYRDGNWLHIQNISPDELIDLLSKVREQDELIDKGRKAMNGLAAILILLLLGSIFLAGFLSPIAGIIAFLLFVAVLIFYLVVNAELKRADVNNTLSQYVPALLERLRFDLAEEAPVSLKAFIAHRYSKELFKEKSKPRSRVRIKHYEISPSVQIDTVLADKSRLYLVVHEYPYEKSVTKVNYRGKVKTKTKYGLAIVHEVNLAIAGELEAADLQKVGVKVKIKEGEKRDKVRLAKKEKHKTGIDKMALIQVSPSVDISMELLYKAYQMLKPGQAA